MPNHLTITIGVFACIVLPSFYALAHEGEHEHQIRITETGYTPSSITISAGDTVQFIDDDTKPHWPASNIHPTHAAYPGSSIEKCGANEHIFDACGGLAQGETFEFTFNFAGEWRFHDHLFPEMTGVIIVTGTSVAELESASMGERLARAWKRLLWKFEAMLYQLAPAKRHALVQATNVFYLAHNDARALEKFVALVGPKDALERLLRQSEKESRDCHQEAHQLGRVSFEVWGARVFSEGSATCHSGFYHGAMESFLATEGIDGLGTKIDELCSSFTTSFGRYQCFHGVGRGVMAYQDYDLLASLQTCTTLSSGFAQRACFGGVFMENVMVALGLGAIPGHTTKWVNDDPHFPCTLLTEHSSDARTECYRMQTARMLQLNGYDFKQTALECGRAEEDMRPACFRSLGRDAAGHVLRDTQKTLNLCAYVPNEKDYFVQCIYGAVNVIMDFWGPSLGGQALEFCGAVDDAPARAACEENVRVRSASFEESEGS